MKTTLTFLIVLIALKVNCQITPINFKDCETDQMFVSAESEPKWNCDTISMIDFMNKFINDKNLLKIDDGKILIGILIYQDGKTCCSSFANLTKVELNAESYKKIIDKMPNWIPAVQNGKKVTFLNQQLFIIKNGKFVLN